MGSAWRDCRAFLFGDEVGGREVVCGEDAGFGGHAEEDAHAFDAFFVEDVVDVGGEIGANGLFGERELAGPVADKCVDVFEAVIAGADEVVGDVLVDWDCG